MEINVVDYVRKWLFVMGVTFITATQTRGFLSGFGLGEIAFLVFVIISFQYNLKSYSSGINFGVLLFILGFLFAALVNLFFELSNIFEPNEIVAISFSIFVSLTVINWLSERERAVEDMATALVFAVLLQVLPIIFLLNGIVMPVWMTDSDEIIGLPFETRYIGFSTNPNQLGLLICAMPPLLLAAYFSVKSKTKKIFYFFGILGSILLSLLIKSNTVFIAYGMAVMLFVYLRFIKYGESSRFHLTPKKISVLLIFLSLSIGLLFSYAIYSLDKTGDGSANGRFQRYIAAFEGIYVSWFIGVGPGGQSGEIAPFEGTEAHNFILDIMLQGGIISLIGYILIVAVITFELKKKKSKLALIVFASVLVEQLSHYTARQPMNWIYLLFPIAISSAVFKNRIAEK